MRGAKRYASKPSSKRCSRCEDLRLLPSPAPSQPPNIAAIGWLSTSILHDLRNPASAISAAAEILVHTEPLPIGVRRLATNIYRAAGRVQELLTDLSGAIH